MNVKCERFKAYEKAGLRGFADLIIEPPGIRLRDCTLNSSEDSHWVGLPSKPPKNGSEKKWLRVVDFASKRIHDDFQTAALKAIYDFRGGGQQSSRRPAQAPQTPEINDEDIPF